MSQQLTETQAWQALEAHYQDIQDIHLRTLFTEDGGRGERLTAEGAGLFLDFSKNRITDETIRLLAALAREQGIESGGTRCSAARRSTSPSGGPCCTLRCVRRGARRSRSMASDVVPEVHEVLDRMAAFFEKGAERAVDRA